jgi:phosphate ABC transporter phosphate-binding protein
VNVMPTAPGTPPIRRFKREIWLSFCALLLLLSSLNSASASTSQPPQNNRSVFVAALDTTNSTNALCKALIERLKKSSGITLASNEKTADTVLRVQSVIWSTGTVSLNPRSNSSRHTNYEGYATSELSDRSDQALWSYLATPSRYRFANITDDLAAQLSTRLLDAAKSGFAPAPVGAIGAIGLGAALRVGGATFPAPLYLKWFESFKQSGGSPITFDPVGSVGGIDQLAAGKLDMAASDIPSTDAAASGKQTLVFPSVIGGVVPIFNLPGGVRDLDLTPQLLADIYSGKIRKWNDPRIRQTNKSVSLPDAEIVVVHRSDGSGTTFVWTSFLAEASADWKQRVGATTEWPVGVGATGNQGVADQVATTANSIGYVELTYAIQHHLYYASVSNHAGRFIKADLASLTAAASKAHIEGGDKGLSLLNTTTANAYPIATFTYFLVPKNSPNHQPHAALSAFLRWMLTTGQRQCSSLGYAPLPRDLINEELQTLNAWK